MLPSELSKEEQKIISTQISTMMFWDLECDAKIGIDSTFEMEKLISGLIFETEKIPIEEDKKVGKVLSRAVVIYRRTHHGARRIVTIWINPDLNYEDASLGNFIYTTEEDIDWDKADKGVLRRLDKIAYGDVNVLLYGHGY